MERRGRQARGITAAGICPRTRAATNDDKRSVTSLVPMLLLFLLIGVGGMYALYELVPD